jgi:NhaP-type Na+/H+ and K+/H+ antiporter
VTYDARLILVAGALLAAGIAASVVASRMRVPALTLFLGLGMLIGSDGLGWAGLRGAIPVILATLPVIRHVPQSLKFFNIVFFAVLLSTAVQGLTIGPLAASLGLLQRDGEPSTSG